MPFNLALAFSLTCALISARLYCRQYEWDRAYLAEWRWRKLRDRCVGPWNRWGDRA